MDCLMWIVIGSLFVAVLVLLWNNASVIFFVKDEKLVLIDMELVSVGLTFNISRCKLFEILCFLCICSILRNSRYY